MKKIFIAIALASVLSLSSPAISHAAWWNPFSWRIFTRSTEPVKASKTEEVIATGKSTVSQQEKKPVIGIKKAEEKQLSANANKKVVSNNSDNNAVRPAKVDKFEISSVDPIIFVNNVDRPIKISGSGFKPGTLIKLNGYTLETTVMASELVQASISRGFPPGDYTLYVKSVDGQQASSQQKITILPLAQGEIAPATPVYQAPAQTNPPRQTEENRVTNPTVTEKDISAAELINPDFEVKEDVKWNGTENYRRYTIKALNDDLKLVSISASAPANKETEVLQAFSQIYEFPEERFFAKINLSTCLGLERAFIEFSQSNYPEKCLGKNLSVEESVTKSPIGIGGYEKDHKERTWNHIVLTKGKTYGFYMPPQANNFKLNHLKFRGVATGKVIERIIETPVQRNGYSLSCIFTDDSPASRNIYSDGIHQTNTAEYTCTSNPGKTATLKSLTLTKNSGGALIDNFKLNVTNSDGAILLEKTLRPSNGVLNFDGQKTMNLPIDIPLKIVPCNDSCVGNYAKSDPIKFSWTSTLQEGVNEKPTNWGLQVTSYVIEVDGQSYSSDSDGKVFFEK